MMVGCVLLGGADAEGECQVESFNLERVGSSVKLVGSSMGGGTRSWKLRRVRDMGGLVFFFFRHQQNSDI
jgi:hypothetical protein